MKQGRAAKFGLTNTNRLIRTYPGCIGLKTGSTSKSQILSLSAVAENNLMLISVIMAAPDYKARLKDAAALLDYKDFARCSLYVDEGGKTSEASSEKEKKKKSLSPVRFFAIWIQTGGIFLK